VMVPVIRGYQTIFLRQEWPVWETLWPVILISFIIVVLGYTIFKKLSGEMVDEL